MQHLQKHIDNQIESNKGKNLFFDDINAFKFITETTDKVSKLGKLDQASKQVLIDYATEKSLKEFCRVNQYYSFDSESKDQLRNIYADLFNDVQQKNYTTEEISKNHYLRLQQWLKNSNPFAEKIYSKNEENVTPVTCGEYDAELQLNILKLDLKNLYQPVLDIGCGSEARLVNYLRDSGIEAYGIDRYMFKESYLKTFDWLEYNYESGKYGTVISNLGFSNHFNHHHLREDGNYIGYGKTYMNIMQSLKVGGCFHYAPDLPFIEMYLDENKYTVSHYPIENYDYKATVVKRSK